MNLKHLKNEKGSITLEFIGVLPFLFFFFLLLWQVVALGTAILSAQSAVNEAAQVYAVSDNFTESKDKAKDIVGSGDIMTFVDFDIPSEEANGSFEAELDVQLHLSFLPDDWVSIPFKVTASGRLLDYE